MLSGARSDSTVRSQVWRSQRDRWFQSLGKGLKARLHIAPADDPSMDHNSSTDGKLRIPIGNTERAAFQNVIAFTTFDKGTVFTADVLLELEN